MRAKHGKNVKTSQEILSIVIPCFNEEKAIPIVVPRVIESLENLKKSSKIKDYELIVVNDQSTDQSVELLKQNSQVSVIHTQNCRRGYGNALKQGFRKAKGQWIGFLDMDNSYRPEDLKRFIAKIEEKNSDFIMGQRAIDERGMSVVRGFGNWLFVLLAKYIYGADLYDVCSGYRVFHRRYLGDVLEISAKGLDFSIYLTLYMVSKGVRIEPLPIQYDVRLGPSKLSVFFDGFAFLKVLLTFRTRQLRALKHRQV